MSKERFARWMLDARSSLRPVPSQEQISEIIGVSQETVSKWERQGVSELSPRTIRRIAACYKVRPVEVAALLDYPTEPLREMPVRPVPENDPVALIDEIVRLQVRLRQLIEERDRERPEQTSS